MIGGQRSGSTLFHDFISSHPKLSPLKKTYPEAKTFLQEDVNLSDYLNSFENPASDFLIEKSTSYHESPAKLIKAKQLFNNVVFLFIARNPVDRAISNYWFSKNAGIENRPIEEALFSNNSLDYTTSVNPFDYINRGKYIDFIELFENHHPKDKLHFFILEEVLSGRKKISEELAKIISVKNEFNCEILLKKINSNPSYPELSEPIKKKLILTFEPYNRLLFNWLNREIKIWN